ncbi:MAG: class I SAM-dependent methyltransferase [Thaumarchaeota archaeon]|nr:class I SAM-dependent methyltransferase [Nitrososphaerota archaeon]
MYPIISSIPFLVDDLSLYFSIRTKLGGYLLLHTKNLKIKSVIKQALQKISHVGNDTTDLEKNWSITYKQSKKSQFHLALQNVITRLPKCNLVIEHGCSIGTTTMALAKKSNTVFGIDKSFFALVEAKKHKLQNADFFLADSLSQPFGKTRFDIVVALNVLELIEPSHLLQVINRQAKKFVILSDPYDYERGKNSVKTRLDETSIRKKMRQYGFRLILNSTKPRFFNWILKVNTRLTLHYKVDLLIASRK